MKEEELQPYVGKYISVRYRHYYDYARTDKIKLDKIDKGRAIFLTENWANDIKILKLSDIVEIFPNPLNHTSELLII